MIGCFFWPQINLLKHEHHSADYGDWTPDCGSDDTLDLGHQPVLPLNFDLELTRVLLSNESFLVNERETRLKQRNLLPLSQSF